MSGNRVYRTGATNGNGIGTGGTFQSDIHDNYLSMSAPGIVLISGFRNFEWSVRGNRVHGAIGRGVYCDTCYASLTEGNTFTGNILGIEDEVNAYSRVIGNNFEHSTIDDWPNIEIAGREGLDQVTLNNGEQVWTCSPNASCSADEVDKRIGKWSIKMTINKDFSGGVVGYGITVAHNVDVSSYMFIRLRIKADKTTEKGSLAVRISSSENFTNKVDQEPLPIIAANDWQQIYVPMRVYWNVPGMTRINSVGIVRLMHSPAMTLHVDDIEVENREMKESVSDNQIEAGAIGIDFLQTTYDCDATGNAIMDVGWWGTARGAVGISDTDIIHSSQNLFITRNIIHSDSTGWGPLDNVGIDDRGKDTHITFNSLMGFLPGRDLVASGAGRVLVGNTN